MKRAFTLFISLAINMVVMFAWDYEHVQIGDLYYNLNATDKTAEVTYEYYNYQGLTTANIPASVTYSGTTYSVTNIGSNAFQYCSSLTSVTIPNSVTSIGNNAFYNCSGLTSVTIGNSVTSIGERAFSYCSNLTSVTIPNSVTSIENQAFYYCSSLTSVTIPNSVTSIGDRAFSGCSSLTSVTIPNSVTSIGDGAFSGCSGLTSVTIPNSVTSIGNYAFQNCSGLTSVTIPNSVTSIGWYTFAGCSSLTSVTIPNSVTSIGNYAFQNCSGLTSVTIPNSVTSIGEAAFRYVNNIIYSGTATGSPWGAKCVNGYVDGYLVYSDATKTILVGCSAAATGEIVIPNSVTSIGQSAFYNCSSLTSVTIPNSVTSIGEMAFTGCSNLTSVTIPYSVTSIGERAFWYCSSLTAITIPNGVQRIEGGTFEDCWNLESVTIPNSVTSIEISAFEDCGKLTSITIPSSATSIGDYAFSYCGGLTTITNYATTPQTINSNVFEKVDLSACTLYVLNESIALYKDADVWKGFNSIEPIGAIQTTMEDDEVDIKPADNSADITWPAVENAYTYELVIKDKNGNVICTLIFNANGQLTSIAFAAPGRGQRAAQVAGFTFTVTSLNSGSEYSYSIAAKGSQGEVLDTKQGSFTTTGGTATALENASLDASLVKVLRNGQIFILRDGKTYTIQGVEVK